MVYHWEIETNNGLRFCHPFQMNDFHSKYKIQNIWNLLLSIYKWYCQLLNQVFMNAITQLSITIIVFSIILLTPSSFDKLILKHLNWWCMYISGNFGIPNKKYSWQDHCTGKQRTSIIMTRQHTISIFHSIILRPFALMVIYAFLKKG